MNEYLLAKNLGITKKAINKVLNKGITEEALFEFLHGNVNSLYNLLPKPSGNQSWETIGKRYVHLEEARFAARHLLRNATFPENSNALVLSGIDPALACIPWAISGLATSFDAFETNQKIYNIVLTKYSQEIEKIFRRIPGNIKGNFNLISGDVFQIKEQDKKYGIIDLDFCSNRLRSLESRKKILELVDKISPLNGRFILRTTLHIGRVNNSRKEAECHIEEFEEELRIRKEGLQRYKIWANDKSSYQSSLPMISLLWILERKTNEIKEKDNEKLSGTK